MTLEPARDTGQKIGAVAVEGHPVPPRVVASRTQGCAGDIRGGRMAPDPGEADRDDSRSRPEVEHTMARFGLSECELGKRPAVVLSRRNPGRAVHLH